MPQLGDIKLGWEIGKGNKNKFIWHACADCSKERWVYFLKEQPVSRICRKCNGKSVSLRLLGSGNHLWKGGRRYCNGYIQVRVYEDDFFFPMAGKDGYVMEHRLTVARALGRCLLSWETVHHKEGYAKDDNRYPETLELLPSRYKHDALTRMIRYIRRLEGEVQKLRAQLK